MTPGYLVTGFARFLIGVLERASIRHLVVSPGSRSTPYLMAAKRSSRLELHRVIDERSAAFVALGLSRSTRAPVALLCTSGTAGANYFPALVEARLTGIPLVALTADRPSLLRDCAAPQTIDQERLFGPHVVGSWSLSPTNASRDALKQLQRVVLTGLSRALSPSDPGPVHFNLLTPKPLESFAAEDADDRAYDALIDQVLGEVPAQAHAASLEPAAASVDALCEWVEKQPQGLITCGFDPELPELQPDVLLRFARASGYPVLLDGSHPLRLRCPPELAPYVVAPYEPLLRLEAFRNAGAPKTILQIGRPLTSRAWEMWSSTLEDVDLWLISRRGIPDPSGRARLLSIADPSRVLNLAASRLERNPPRSSGWQSRWLRAGQVTADTAKTELLRPHAGSSLGELAAVSRLLDCLPSQTRLVVGNSLPIRHLDWMALPEHGGTRAASFDIVALRGASGIDGITSVAVGVAQAGDAPVALLIGDVSFLHDIGALYAAADVRAPLVIVVLNNGGGRIFEQLPIGRVTTPEELDFWTTPHNIRFEHAAKLYGLPYRCVTSHEELQGAVQEATSHAGTTLIEVLVTTDSARTQPATLLHLIGDALVDAGLLASHGVDE